jgi:hypothetical protein
MDFFSRRCFFRATPLLAGHKFAFPQKTKKMNGAIPFWRLTKESIEI